MSEEKVESKLDQLSGKAKEVTGQVLGDKKLEAEGKTEGAVGKVKEMLADATDTLKGAVDGIKDAFDKE